MCFTEFSEIISPLLPWIATDFSITMNGLHHDSYKFHSNGTCAPIAAFRLNIDESKLSPKGYSLSFRDTAGAALRFTFAAIASLKLA
jgi:hypothetical protein